MKPVLASVNDFWMLSAAVAIWLSWLDASQALVELSVSRVEGTFLAGEMEELPFADGTFDVVLIANGLHTPPIAIAPRAN
ncbi:MAG: class I SAM-dependent methyltransferase [Vulcanimicrobiaceae bacterium]